MKNLGLEFKEKATEESPDDKTFAVIWDSYNPHPMLFGQTNNLKEVIFCGEEGAGSFNQSEPASKGLNELIFVFAGQLSALPDAVSSGLKFTPMVTAGPAVTSMWVWPGNSSVN